MANSKSKAYRPETTLWPSCMKSLANKIKRSRSPPKTARPWTLPSSNESSFQEVLGHLRLELLLDSFRSLGPGASAQRTVFRHGPDLSRSSVAVSNLTQEGARLPWCFSPLVCLPSL